jgi:hemerythrin
MSELFVWREEYALGLPEIDAQHRRLFEFGRRLAAGEPVLEDLASSVRNHFRTEEALMETCGCASCTEHKAEHESLLAHLIASPADPAAVVDAWVCRHIVTCDRKLAEERRGQRVAKQ